MAENSLERACRSRASRSVTALRRGRGRGRAPPVKASDGPAAGCEVRLALRVAGDLGPVRRLAARPGGPGAQRALRKAAEYGSSRAAHRDVVWSPPPGCRRDVPAVAVEVLALAGDAHQRVPELLRRSGAARRARRRRSCSRRVGQDVLRRAARQQVGLAHAAAGSAGPPSRARRCPAAAPWPGRPARPRDSSGASRRSTGTSPRPSPPSRARRAGSRGRTRAWPGTTRSAHPAPRRRLAASARSSRIDARRFVASAADAATVRVEVHDQALQLRLVAAQALRRAASPRSSRDRSCARRPAAPR